MHIGDVIRQARSEKGFSVRDLAQQAQVSASYVYAIESGSRGSHIDKLWRIAKALNLSLDELCIRSFES